MTVSKQKYKLIFEIEIECDGHPVEITDALLRELGDDVASAIAGHEQIEENGVTCLTSREA